MKKKNYLFLAVGFSTLLMAGCGPSIEDAQRHAEKAAEAVASTSIDLVDNNQSPSKRATNVVTNDDHIAELEPNTLVASVDEEKTDGTQQEEDKIIPHDEESHADVAPEQIHTDDESVAESEKQRMLDKISVLRDRLQHARTSKEEATRNIEQIHRLLSDNEAEMETLLNTLDNVEQSVQQLDQEINDIATEVVQEELPLASESILIEEGVLDDVLPSDILVEENTTNTVSE